MKKIWKVKDRKYDDIMKQLLFNRGVDVSDESLIRKFLKPSFGDDLNDASLLPDINSAINRIRNAQEKEEKIGIFADYDADGIPGAAFLAKTLEKIGVKYETYIPNRENGYGLSKAGIDYLLANKCSLIVTVDLGIKSFLEADYCREKKIDLIITDHHTPLPELPDCIAVINPKIESSKYPFRELCGAGVAYKLAVALSKFYPNQISEAFLKWNLDLITISTISDVVPVLDENRTICVYGLRVLSKTRNVGIKEIIATANLDPKLIKAHSVGFQIGPRINAPGRMDHATKSYQILVTNDTAEAKELSKWLEAKNIERQEQMEAVGKEAICLIEAQNLDKDNIIVVSGKWPKGVIGPTASRLVEKYARPVILFSSSDSVYTGSARSVEGVNIVEILGLAKQYLSKYGGHKGAAGLSLASEDFELFNTEIQKIAREVIKKADLAPIVKIDCEIDSEEINLSFIDNLAELEPHGMGNPRPVFVSYGLTISSMRFVGHEEKHLSLLVNDGKKDIKAIFFNCLDKELIDSTKGHKIDIAYNLCKDEWNGNCKPSLNIVDLRISDGKKR